MLSEQRPHNTRENQRCTPPDFTDPYSTLMAHRVIPLQQTNGKRTLKGAWLVCGGFVMALCLGATSGMVLGHFELKAASSVQVNDPAMTLADPLDSASFSEDTSTPISVESIPAVANESFKTIRPKRMVGLKAAIPFANHSSGTAGDETDELKRIRAELLVDYAQKRRVRIPQRHEPQ